MRSPRLLMTASALILAGSLFLPTASAWQLNGDGIHGATCSYNEGTLACRICGPNDGDSLAEPYAYGRYGGSFAYVEVYYATTCGET
jgi:hypothetical protein